MARLFDDGSSEYLEIDSTPVSALPICVSCWTYPDTVSIGMANVFVGDKDVGSNRVYLSVRGAVAGDPLRWTINTDGGSTNVNTSNGVSINTWHHCFGQSTAVNNHKVVLDGDIANQGTNSTSVVSGGHFDRVSIGRLGDSTPALYYSGRVAEVAIWIPSSGFSDAEIIALAKGYSPLFVRPQDLVAYWSLIRDEDQDRVGGYDLTAFNTPSIASHVPIIYPSMIFNTSLPVIEDTSFLGKNRILGWYKTPILRM